MRTLLNYFIPHFRGGHQNWILDWSRRLCHKEPKTVFRFFVHQLVFSPHFGNLGWLILLSLQTGHTCELPKTIRQTKNLKPVHTAVPNTIKNPGKKGNLLDNSSLNNESPSCRFWVIPESFAWIWDLVHAPTPLSPFCHTLALQCYNFKLPTTDWKTPRWRLFY